jgi:hypothetical protein
MTLPRVAVVYQPGGAASLHDIHQAAAGVCEPVILIPGEVAVQPQVLAAAGAGFQTQVVKEPLAEVCTLLGVTGLTTFHDLQLDRVDEVLRLFGWPGAGDVDHPWDKLTQRERIPADISVPAAAVNSVAEFQRGIDLIGMPAVLKPRRATGGNGLAFVLDQDDVLHQIRARKRWDGLILEERSPMIAHPSGVPHLAGFVSVETVCTADARRHVAIVDKVKATVHRRAGDDGTDTIRGTGDVVPSRLGQADGRQVLLAVDRSLAALGIRWRVTHTEVALTPGGPVVIEVNGRVGGHLNRLMNLAGGTDLARAALQCAVGVMPDIRGRPISTWAMGYYPTFPVLGGPVRSHVSRRAIRAFPGVVGVSEIARRGADRSETGARMANLTVSADDAGTLDSCFRRIRTGIEELFANDSLPAERDVQA